MRPFFAGILIMNKIATQSAPHFQNRAAIAAAFALTLLLSCRLFAATPPAAEDAKTPPKPAVPARPAEPQALKIEEVTIPTGDNVQISATYYHGARGEESIPLLLLHGFGAKHNRTDYTKEFAPLLQSKGFAVIVPDLRGHGESTRLKTIRGKDETLDAATFAPQQFGLMVTQDLTAVKDFLWARNNAHELNLDKLCVVGAEMGASLAVDFTLYDSMGYEQGRSNYGSLKLGRFVKALVLLSPETSFKGISVPHAVQNPAVWNDISVLLLVGEADDKALKEAKRVNSVFERNRPKPDPEKEADQRTLFFTPLETKLQGASLLADKNLKVQDIILAFLNLRLAKNDAAKTWVWKERKLPHQ